MSTILGFGTALPEHIVGTAASAAALRHLWPRLRTAAVPEAFTRYTVEPLEEIVNPRGLGQAMRVYAEHAPRLARLASCRALAAASVEPDEIDLVIAVSCTGYLVPSLDVQLAAEIGLRPDVIRLPLTELGCSGGAAALAAAHRHLSARPRDRVLVVAVELCSLSFQPGDHSLSLPSSRPRSPGSPVGDPGPCPSRPCARTGSRQKANRSPPQPESCPPPPMERAPGQPEQPKKRAHQSRIERPPCGQRCHLSRLDESR